MQETCEEEGEVWSEEYMWELIRYDFEYNGMDRTKHRLTAWVFEQYQEKMEPLLKDGEE